MSFCSQEGRSASRRSGVCPSVGGGSLYQEGVGGFCIRVGFCLQEGSTSGRGVGRPSNWILWDTVNERAVRILLECILVSKNIISVQYKFKVQAISTNTCAKLTAVNTGTEVTDSSQVTPNSIGPFSRVTVGKKAL